MWGRRWRTFRPVSRHWGSRSVASEVTNRVFGDTTHLAVRAFQEREHLPVTGDVDALMAGRLNQLLEEPVPAGRRVSGRVQHADGSFLQGLAVRAFHRRIGGEVVLGQGRTSERGEYLIPYEFPPDVTAVDLFVRAFDETETVVAVSPLVLSAGQQAALNLTVSEDRLRGSSEFAKATAALESRLAAVPLEVVDANDVAHLVRRTGVSRVVVTAWIAALLLARRWGLDHESIYALVRAEDTASLPRLLRRPAGRLTRAVSRAAERNVVSKAIGERAPAIVGRLRQLAIQLSASPETPGSLGRVLATSTRASVEQQRELIARYARHQGTARELWTALGTDSAFGAEVVADLQLTVQLGALTANHPPLVKALRGRGLGRAADSAVLTRDDWRQLLLAEVDGQGVGTPSNIKGETDVERRENYLDLLMERSTLAFPTAHVARALRTLPDGQASGALAFSPPTAISACSTTTCCVHWGLLPSHSIRAGTSPQ